MSFLGIDVGTQGVRAVVCDVNGKQMCAFDEKFKELNVSNEEKYKEQIPAHWWSSAVNVIAKCTKAVGKITSISLDGTSGTILPIDKDANVLCNGLMYNDARGDKEAQYIHSIAQEHEKKHGYVFNSSYALPKILWIKNNRPDIYEKTYKFIHQADYIVGKLSGTYDITDYSNALKTGYDLIDNKWGAFIEQFMDVSLLPKVVAPGEIIAYVNKECSKQTGLTEKTPIHAGVSDGYASSLAAGLALPGQWVTIIGTTLVLKGITKELILDEQGRIYSHKHPEGWWMPGGASNVGGKILNEMFGEKNFDEYNKHVEEYTPTEILCYPLLNKGERFPFVNKEAQGFMKGSIINDFSKYAGVMEGVAYVERLSYDTMKSLGCDVGDTLLTAGGACKSEEWLQIRANVLNKELKVPTSTDAAIGSVVIAALSEYENLHTAVENMIKIKKTVTPIKTPKYDELYQQFVEACKDENWI